MSAVLATWAASPWLLISYEDESNAMHHPVGRAISPSAPGCIENRQACEIRRYHAVVQTTLREPTGQHFANSAAMAFQNGLPSTKVLQMDCKAETEDKGHALWTNLQANFIVAMASARLCSR